MTSDRGDKSDLGDETPRGQDPGGLAVAANERERVLAENAEEIRRLGKRAVGDVIEIGRGLAEMKEIRGRGNWLPWLQREFGWTDRHALNFTRVYDLSRKSENFSDLRISVSGLYLLAAPSTPSEAVDEVIERAKSGERQTHAEIKGKIDEIKRVKATAAGIKPQRGSSKCPSEDFLIPLNHLDSMEPILIRGGAYIVDGQEPGEVRPRSLEISGRPYGASAEHFIRDGPGPQHLPIRRNNSRVRGSGSPP